MFKIKDFISTAEMQISGEGTTKEAKSYANSINKKFENLNVHIRFGIGRASSIPWIAFLGYNQKVTNGIYPVFLYYKEIKLLVLAYGVSETTNPLINWDNSNSLTTIKSYFKAQNFPKPSKYENSFVYKAYKTDEEINENKINQDLKELIQIFHQRFSKLQSPIITPIPDLQIPLSSEAFLKITKSAGLIFSTQLIQRFTASLLTKPFVLLTGLSGSGKTKLAQAFVQWISADESQYRIVPVGSDWTNREPLLGYPNGLKDAEYVLPDCGALQLMINASKNVSKPYFLVLDEMNLSHVERYFADFLSVMESEDSIKLYDGKIRKNEELEIPQTIQWPKNLFVIGTVNIDETTYMFSPKVLDRANVIEFRINYTEMSDFIGSPERKPIDLKVLNNKGKDMAESFINLAQDKSIAKIDESKVLIDFFKQLQLVGAEFGYRSANEIELLITKLGINGFVNEEGEPIENNIKIDIAIMQKLLPKLHGSRTKLVPVLSALGRLCIEDVELDDREFIKNNFDGEPVKTINFKISFEKVKRMYKNVLANGFTSYAEA